MNLKSFIHTALVAVTLAAGAVPAQAIEFAASGSYAGERPTILLAQVAGEWTKCVAWHKGEQWNIVGGTSRDVCFAKARKCTNNRNVNATYYSSPVIINAPYRRCVTIL